jgi:hypothetical protein
MTEVIKKTRGRPRKEKVEKERQRIYRYETEEERLEGQKKARDKYNDKKLYSNKITCECGEIITVGNKSRHLKSIRHMGLLHLNKENNIQLENSI